MKKTIFPIFFSSIFFLSCKKFVTIPPPQTQLESRAIFENEQAAIAATAGLYSQSQSALILTNGGATLYPALSADEIINTAANEDYDPFATNNIQFNSSSGLNRLWQMGYRNIYHANAILEGLKNSSALRDSIKNILWGEMLLFRSLSYFYLANLFGDVPLVTTTDYTVNASLPRSAVSEVYDLVIADLVKAKELLPLSYGSAGRIRPNKWAAAALLGRVYLYRQKWQEAETEATAVINSGMYNLPPLANVFLANSPEALWQIAPVSTVNNTAEGNLFNPISATSRPSLAITSHLLNAFETADTRKTVWLKFNTVSSQIFYYPNKYKVRTGAPPYTENYTILRLAEQYLIRAEARAQLNNFSGARDDLNRIRNRAGLPATAANDQTTLLDAIMQERRIELLVEWGHRWLDLKRTGRINGVMQVVKGANWQATDALYPISQYELDTNPFLTQNPGY